eukprot:756487-Hanusia_phi.AAC.7
MPRQRSPQQVDFHADLQNLAKGRPFCFVKYSCAAEAPKPQTPAAPSAAPAAPQPASKPAAAPASAPQFQVSSMGERIDRRVPMSRMRKRIAERLKDSQNTAAMLTTYNEIDMTSVIEMRNLYKDEFQKKHNIKLGFMSAFVSASAKALKALPIVNAVIDGDDIVYRDYIDISVAVSSPTGLVVPVLRDVQNLSFAAIEGAINHYGEKAQNGDACSMVPFFDLKTNFAGSLALEDMAGGTFTISNGGHWASGVNLAVADLFSQASSAP